jgi:uncharacterized protein with NRDE domain
MCTISVVPTVDGFRVVSNRDERYDRPVAHAPSEHILRSGTATFPVDPATGGTWIGINGHRVVAGLLNRYPLAAFTHIPSQSRGVIIPHVLNGRSITETVDAALSLDAREFAPFRLLLLDGRDVYVVSSCAEGLTCATGLLASPMMLTGSALGDFVVETPRRRLFDRLIAASPSLRDGQTSFHQHQWADRRDISVLMQRQDAATVSRTSITVSHDGASIEYERLW